MQNESLVAQLRKLAEDVSTREGCTLYDLEFTGGGGGRILRVYIDKDNGDNVSIDDCANVSRGLNLILDVEDAIPGGQYHLEVSSPGLERVLRKPWHFEKAVGKTISVKTFAPLLQFNEELVELGKAKQLQGLLKSVAGEQIVVEASMAGKMLEVKVPFETITKANIQFNYEQFEPVKPGAKGPKKKP